MPGSSSLSVASAVTSDRKAQMPRSGILRPMFAVAELRSATAITDDREAVRVARTYGLDVHGTIWLLSGACRGDKLSEPAAGNLLDALRATGATAALRRRRVSQLCAPSRTLVGTSLELNVLRMTSVLDVDDDAADPLGWPCANAAAGTRKKA